MLEVNGSMKQKILLKNEDFGENEAICILSLVM